MRREGEGVRGTAPGAMRNVSRLGRPAEGVLESLVQATHHVLGKSAETSDDLPAGDRGQGLAGHDAVQSETGLAALRRILCHQDLAPGAGRNSGCW
jgi:hypothetical protein